MQYSTYRPYVSNLVGSFSEAKWTIYKHAHALKYKNG